MLAVHSLYTQYKGKQDQMLEMVVKPQKGLFATKQISEGELKLVPVGPISFGEATKKTPANVVILPTSESISKVLYITQKLVTQKQAEADGLDEFMVPFWFVRDIQDKSYSNTKYEEVSVNVAVGKKKVTLQIPILTNSADLKPGDEILSYKVDSSQKPVDPDKTSSVAASGRGQKRKA